MTQPHHPQTQPYDSQQLREFVASQVLDLPNPQDVEWRESSYPGDDDEPAFRFRYRDFNGHDRLTIARWEHDHAVGLDQGLISEEESEHVGLVIESAAMALRMTTSGGEPYTEAALVALYGRSPAAWMWLSQFLFAPIWRECESGARRRKLADRSRLLRLLQRLTLAVQREHARTA